MSHKRNVRVIVFQDGKLLVMKRNKFGSEYYTLVGGGVKLNETLENALWRELHEETGIEVGSARLVFVEDDGGFYGTQYVYLCDYKGGQPALREDSDEAQISAMGQNTYETMWLPLEQLKSVSFRSTSVAEAILDGIQNGFPQEPRQLDWKPEIVRK